LANAFAVDPDFTMPGHSYGSHIETQIYHHHTHPGLLTEHICQGLEQSDGSDQNHQAARRHQDRIDSFEFAVSSELYKSFSLLERK
jgi:hypothetical protein